MTLAAALRRSNLAPVWTGAPFAALVGARLLDERPADRGGGVCCGAALLRLGCAA